MLPTSYDRMTRTTKLCATISILREEMNWRYVDPRVWGRELERNVGLTHISTPLCRPHFHSAHLMYKNPHFHSGSAISQLYTGQRFFPVSILILAISGSICYFHNLASADYIRYTCWSIYITWRPPQLNRGKNIWSILKTKPSWCLVVQDLSDPILQQDSPQWDILCAA